MSNRAWIFAIALGQAALAGAGFAALVVEAHAPTEGVVGVAVAPNPTTTTSEPSPPTTAPSPPLVTVPPVDNSCHQVAIVGDSLSYFAAGALQELIPGVIVGAAVGAPTGMGEQFARDVLERGVDPDCWVFALGTNDLFAGDDPSVGWQAAIDSALSVPDPGDRVWWVEPVALNPSRFNEAGFVELIPEWVERIVPAPPPEDYDRDGVHFTEAGYRHRAEMIAEVLP